MLTRRILRIKAFQILYSYAENPSMTLKSAQSQLEKSCQAAQDLYLFLLGIAGPLTREARSRLEAARGKFNPTEEERNPNMKFAENALAPLLEEDIDLKKLLEKKKLSWDQQDAFLRKLYEEIREKDWFRAYLDAPGRSLEEDARVFTKIYEECFLFNEDLAAILEDANLWWTDDLAYALTECCKACRELGRGGRWSLPPLFNSRNGDHDFVVKLLSASYAAYDRYAALVASNVPSRESDRLFATDTTLVVMGLAEAASFPEIPVKVTINEYVEISKEFCTSVSHKFINGVLDKLIGEMVADGTVVKSGRGLL